MSPEESTVWIIATLVIGSFVAAYLLTAPL
jgi:hypothetical protein